ncbi:tyrosine-type recombinase/integrase [Spirillospora sp. NPDC048911]|uniref:tyrosine-type recombinase/integrase n=1 Tax=Spirillospora sp. NPDC048911 TaxID=3364527 RepID=UPI0037226068
MFKRDTKQHDPRRRGYTLHQLRHSRLTHLAEDGWSAPMLMALSGHENIRSLAIYTKSQELHQTGENPQVAS